jgi:hypothetical protein
MLKLYKNNLAIILLASLSMSVLANTATAEKVKPVPLIYSGESIQPISDTHYRIKVSYNEAAKMRCVGFADEKSVAIDSIVVFPPYGVANMLIGENDEPITRVQCWVTSTRTEDLKRDYIQHDTSGSL